MTARLARITVDGVPHAASAGEPVLDVLRRAGVDVPTLCHDDRLRPLGTCRVCVVARRDGEGSLVAACATSAEDGMVIDTQAADVIDARRRALQRLVLSHRLECPVCERHGDCVLEDLVHLYGIPDEPLSGGVVAATRDDASPLIVRDAARCVGCGRCVRLCDEIQGVGEMGRLEEGDPPRVILELDRALDCEFCGQCVDACPTAALVARPFISSVPAWRREAVTTTCSYCSCGCQLTVESVGGRIVRVRSSSTATPNRGKLCVKGRFAGDCLETPERLHQPLLRREGRLVPASWNEALDALVGAIRRAREESRAVVGFGTPRLTCEDAYLFQCLLRRVVGTPHLGVGLTAGASALVDGVAAVMGVPRSTATLGDLSRAEAVLVVRADPTRTHPLVKTELVEGARRGQTLVLAHALSGGLGHLARVHLTLRPLGEEAFLLGLARVVVREGLTGEAAPRNVEGFEAWRDAVESYTPDIVEGLTGVAPEQLRRVARTLAEARSVVGVLPTGLGIPGDEAAVARALCGLLLVLGLGGRPGSGVLALGEKANLQGCLDVGLHQALLPGAMPAAEPAAREGWVPRWGAPLVGERGWAPADAMERAGRGEVGVLYLVGHDPIGGWPRATHRRDGLAGASFVAVQDAFLTKTAQRADVVLPASILYERQGTLVGADGTARKLCAAVPAPAGVASDGQIFAEVAHRMGASLPGGEELDCEVAAALSAATTRSGRCRLVAPEAPPPPRTWSGTLLDASPQLMHSGSTTRYSRRLQELAPTVAVRLHPSDAAALGVSGGELLHLTTGTGEEMMRVRLDRTVRPGTAVVLWQSNADGLGAFLAVDGEARLVDIRTSG